MNRIVSYNSQGTKSVNKQEQNKNQRHMQQQKYENQQQTKPIPSLKILNQQIQQIMQIKSICLTRQQQQMICKIINHARTSHNIREYINLRYTNKLAYILDKFEMSNDIRSLICEELQRVKLLVTILLSDTSAFFKMEMNVFGM